MSNPREYNVPQTSRPVPISSLYVLKSLFAFLVVTCHVPLDITGHWLEPVARGAVSVFFLISGYFLYAPSLAKSCQRAIRSFRNIVPIYILVSVFYWLWLLPNNGNLMNSWQSVVVWLTTGAMFSGHLWYLVAMLQALIVLALVFKSRQVWLIYLFPALSVFGLLGSQYGFLISSEHKDYVYNVYNVVCYGLPCMSAGYLVRKFEDRLLAMGDWLYALVIIIGLLYLERWVLEMTGHTYASGAYLGSYLFAGVIFVVALQHKSLGQGSLMEHIGMCYSGNIYYFHIALSTLLVRILVPIYGLTFYKLFGAVLVFLLSWAVAWLVVKAQEKLGISVLR